MKSLKFGAIFLLSVLTFEGKQGNFRVKERMIAETLLLGSVNSYEQEFD